MAKSDAENFQAAVYFIYQNIDQSLQLELVANNIHMSLASLKRLFNKAIGCSPGAFIRRLRMELAYQSLQGSEQSILEIALASGFDDQAAFARSFKQLFGRSPSKVSNTINIVSELECVELQQPDTIKLNEINLQIVTEVGPYFDSAPKAWAQLKKQLCEYELSDNFAGLFIGIGHDNPHEGNVTVDQVRFSAGVSHASKDLVASTFLLTAGNYLRFRYYGKPNNLGLAYHYIFGQYEQKSAIEIDVAKPAFTMFGSIPDGFLEQEIMICVPIKS